MIKGLEFQKKILDQQNNYFSNWVGGRMVIQIQLGPRNANIFLSFFFCIDTINIVQFPLI